MSRAVFDEQLEANRAAYTALRDRLWRDYAGQYVALAHGKVVGTGPSYDGAYAATQRLDPAPEHFIVFEADQEAMFDVIDDFLEIA
jgi:hypothetical protein